MLRRAIAFSIGFAVVGAVSTAVVGLVTGAVPFGVCINGWPPPIFLLALMSLLWFLSARCVLALATGVALAACVHASVRAGRILIVGLAIPLAFEAWRVWSEVMRVREATGVGISALELLRHEALYLLVLHFLPSALSGLAISRWAMLQRRRIEAWPPAETDEPGSPAARARALREVPLMGAGTPSRILRSVALVLGVLAVIGLLASGLSYEDFRAPADPNRAPTDFSFASILNQGPIFPVPASLIVLGLACLAWFAASWHQRRTVAAHPGAEAERAPSGRPRRRPW